MFQHNNHKYYNQKVYNNSAKGSLIFFSGAVVIGLFVLIIYAAFSAFDAWSNAVSRTWSPGNNDTLISYLGGAFYAGVIVVGVLVTLTILPFIVRLWAVQINALNQLPRREQPDDWRVIDAAPTGENDEQWLIDAPDTTPKLLPMYSQAQRIEHTAAVEEFAEWE